MEESYFEEDMGKEDIHKKQRRRRTLMVFFSDDASVKSTSRSGYSSVVE